MTKKKATNSPATIDGASLYVLPPPQIKLATVENCRREMARVYRDARTGKTNTADASRMVFMLISIAKMIEIEQAAAPKQLPLNDYVIPDDPVEAERAYRRLVG